MLTKKSVSAEAMAVVPSYGITLLVRGSDFGSKDESQLSKIVIVVGKVTILPPIPWTSKSKEIVPAYKAVN